MLGEPATVHWAKVPVSKLPFGTVTTSTGGVCRSWFVGGTPTGPPGCSKPAFGGAPSDVPSPSRVWFSGYRGSAPEGAGTSCETRCPVAPASCPPLDGLSCRLAATVRSATAITSGLMRRA